MRHGLQNSAQFPLPALKKAGKLALVGILLFPMITYAMQSPFLSAQQARHEDLSAFTKWTSVLARYNAQRATMKCKDESCPEAKWEAMIAEQKGKSTMAQIEAVNDFFNAVTYIEDNANYGVEDYWATPYEFMQRGGDCEDYAIAKYLTLKRLGIPESVMRIVILQDNNLGGIMHAVLEVRQGDKRLLLDNQAKEVVDESTIYHYRPIYALNGTAWWTYQ
jgi:predicted transglutaminase-like cysteine proteinase